MICLQSTVTMWQRINSADLKVHVWIFNLICPLIEDHVYLGGGGRIPSLEPNFMM